MPIFTLSDFQRVAVSIVGALFLSAACMSVAASAGPLAFVPHATIA